MDKQNKELSEKYQENGTLHMILFLRFLDDIIQLFIGTTKELHTFFEEVNQIHPTLKFTLSHTSVNFEEAKDKRSCKNKSPSFF